MENEIIKAEQFGIEKSKANELTLGLQVTIDERKLLIEEFDKVKDMEITESNIPKFKALRLKIVKNRTQGIIKWHKTNKDFFLTGGRFVDAIKNKEVQINESMETVLMEAEKHFENLEKERIEKLQLERSGKLLAFNIEVIPQNLGSMDDSMWSTYIVGIETTFKARVEAEKLAEKQRLEAEKKAKMEAEIEAKRIEAQRLENERLKKEAEIKEAARLKAEKEQKAKEDKIKADAEAKLKAERKAKEKEISELKAKQEAKDKADRLERERLAKIESDKQAIYKAEQAALIEKERKEKARLEAELKARQDEELKARSEQQAKEKAAKMAPEKTKLETFANMIINIDLPDVKTEEAKKIVNNVEALLKKVNGYIMENVDKL